MGNIVVLGGSFNPPTKAHKELMLKGMERINASLGIYLPADISYLNSSRKDVKDNEIIPNEIRKDMLLSMHTEKNIIVEEYEFTTHKRAHTYESLKYIQSIFPKDKIFFITGSDKLNVISRWRSSDSLLNDFSFLVVSRKEDNVPQILENNQKLNKYKEKFVEFEIDEDYQKISSTDIRRIIRGTNYSDLDTLMDKNVKQLYLNFLNK